MKIITADSIAFRDAVTFLAGPTSEAVHLT